MRKKKITILGSTGSIGTQTLEVIAANLLHSPTRDAGGGRAADHGGGSQKRSVQLLPVDSEHSAIFQCLEGTGTVRLKKYS